MPYIPDDDRASALADQIKNIPQTPGELNFIISEIAALYTMEHFGKEPKYAERSEVHSQIQCAANEFQRRMLDPYETKKMMDNANRDPYLRFQ